MEEYNDNHKHYSQKELQSVLDTFSQTVERKDNGILMQSLFDNSVIDLENFVSGDFTIDTDSYATMDEFIKVFGTRYNGEFTPSGEAAHKHLLKLIEKEKQRKRDFLEAKRFANNKNHKEKASLDSIIYYNRLLRQDRVAASALQNVKPEIDKMNSLAQRKMEERLKELGKMSKNGISPTEAYVKETERFLKEFDYSGARSYLPTVNKLRKRLKDFSYQKGNKNQINEKTIEIKPVESVLDKVPEGRTKYVTIADIAKSKTTEIIPETTTEVNIVSKKQKKHTADVKAPTRWEKFKSSVKNTFNKSKKWLIGGALVVGGLLLMKNCGEEKKEKDNSVFLPSKEIPISPVDSIQKSDTLKLQADEVAKAYYDSALKIHLGEKKRDALYSMVEQSVEQHNLNLGTLSIEHFAHSMVMYKEIQPNNQINKVFAKVLQGTNISQLDNLKMKAAVYDAGEYGDGVKGKGKNSNFDKQSSSVQQNHIQALKAFRQATH